MRPWVAIASVAFATMTSGLHSAVTRVPASPATSSRRVTAHAAVAFDVEECILEALSEDEVQTCLQIMDDMMEQPERAFSASPLADCLSSTQDLDECIAISDENNEPSYG